VECPRDAMQGIKEFIPTEKKVKYLNALLQVGFDTIDCGSFVSAKAIPQMSDTAEVLKRIESLDLRIDNTNSKLLAIIANYRGAEEACAFDEITYLGFPFSVSEEFQKRNTNSTIEESLKRVEEIQKLCEKKKKQLVVYISMGFGNPYGEPWNAEIVFNWVKKLSDLNIKIFALSDTVGVSNPENITHLFSHLIPALPGVEFGAHLHSHPETRTEKLKAAYDSGVRRFDSAIRGIGGCPMANDELVGNMSTEELIGFLDKTGEKMKIDRQKLQEAIKISSEVF
jgi:hydroxymethylglutaryl-CoA lyase